MVIGVIILNWNGLEDTRACLRSLQDGSAPPHVFYVVDNGSTDGSAEAIAREFGDNVRLIRNRRNLLFAGGNNIGIRRALADGCDGVLLLNNDTVVQSGMLEAMRAAWVKTGEAVLCPKIYYAGSKRFWYAGGTLKLHRALARHRGIGEADRGQYDVMGETDWATGCALFAPRAVFDRVGLLDEGFGLYAEDLDFCIRAKQAGFPVYYVPEAVVEHKVSASLGGNWSIRKNTLKSRALRRLLRKHLPGRAHRMVALLDLCLTEPFRSMRVIIHRKIN